MPYKWSPKAADFINQVNFILYFSYCKEILRNDWVGTEFRKSNNIRGWLMSIGEPSKRKLWDRLTFLWASKKTMMTTKSKYPKTLSTRMPRKRRWCWEIKKCKLSSQATSLMTPKLSGRKVCVLQTALILSTFHWEVLGSEVIVLITLYVFFTIHLLLIWFYTHHNIYRKKNKY